MRWFQTSYFFIVVIIILLGLNGCALSPPSTEVLIFKQEDSSRSSERPIFQPRSPATGQENYSNRISNPKPINISFRPRISGELEYAKDKFATFVEKTLDEDNTLTENDLTIRNSYYFSLGIPITLLNHEKVNWALNAGFPVLGTDATTNLAPRTYVTANLGFGDGEVILQQKIAQNKTLGIALGGYYRAERRGFEIQGDEISLLVYEPLFDALSPDRIFYNHIIGGRINGFLGSPSKSYVMLRAAPGYAINLEQFVLNFSISVRFSSSK